MAKLAEPGLMAQWFIRITEPIVFGRRDRTLFVVILLTLFFGWQASQIQPDAGFEKQLPLEHPYIKVFKEYQKDFGGANLVLFALIQKDGDIYNAEFLTSLQKATDEVFFLPGIDRSRVSSLFTPDVRFIEVVEGGFSGGNIIPADFQPTPEMLERVRSNVGKSRYVGRLVANDHSGAMIFSELLEFDPLTDEKLDYAKVSRQLEEIRGRFTRPVMYEYRLEEDRPPRKAGDVVATGYVDVRARLAFEKFEIRGTGADGVASLEVIKGGDVTVTELKNPDYNPNIDLHIIGFAKIVGDVSDAAAEVVGFFALTLLMTLLLLWLYCGSLRIALLPLSCAVLAVIWEIGLLRLFGYGLDPFAILVPFLVLSVGVSHGVQITNFWLYEMADHGLASFEASRATYRRLVIPGITALLTNVAGFGTILLIPIDIIQEMAINACFGCLAIIITKKVLLPILLSYSTLKDPAKFRAHQQRRDRIFDPLWKAFAAITDRRAAAIVLAGAGVVGAASLWLAGDIKIGDLHAGVPELRPDSRYNRDSVTVAKEFAIGVDVLKVMTESKEQGCIDHRVMETIDDYVWRMTNTPGVQSVMSLGQVGKLVNAGYNEGSLKWRILSRNSSVLVQSISPFDTATGLLNYDCKVMPVLIFTVDHRAETIDGIIQATEAFTAELPADAPVKFRLASGNVGVMAATNQVIAAKEWPMLIWVYVAIAACVWISFRNFAGMICVLVPLALVTVVSYAVMVLLQIGLKVSTLPVAAFAAGIGVDYGIYIYSVLEECVNKGMPLRKAYENTMHQTGKAVVFTGLTLAASVCTWLFSGLQFQVDMGALLTLMFLANMVGAMLLLPAFAAFLVKPKVAAAAP